MQWHNIPQGHCRSKERKSDGCRFETAWIQSWIFLLSPTFQTYFVQLIKGFRPLGYWYTLSGSALTRYLQSCLYLKDLCVKVSEVTSLKKLLQFEAILRTLNIEPSSAYGGFASRHQLLGSLNTSKKNPLLQNTAYRPGTVYIWKELPLFCRFMGGIFGQETPNFIDPYLQVLLYYMIYIHKLRACNKMNISS